MTSFSLHGRIALVTGSSQGIGAAIAIALAEAGADIAIPFIGRAERAGAVRDNIVAMGRRAVLIPCDLGDRGNNAGPKRIYQETAAALGHPDILVLNASVQIVMDWLSITSEDLDRQVSVNFRASLELLQLAVPHMKAQRWGRILTIGSVQEIRPHPDMLVYSALKNAQTAMARSLAKQLAPFGITVNSLAPGVIETERNAARLADAAYAENVRSRIPAGCFGEPSDCAGAAVMLCSEASRYITGQNLFIDGGMSL